MMSCSSTGSSWSSSPGLACSPERPAPASRSCSTRLGWRLARAPTAGWCAAGPTPPRSAPKSSSARIIRRLLCSPARGSSCDPGEPLIARRSVKVDGGSRAFVGGSAVPAAVLRDFGALAVEIHGQHDDRGLLNPKGHRALLDLFGSIDLAPIERCWARGDADRAGAGDDAGGGRRCRARPRLSQP